MALIIDDSDAADLAEKLAQRTGETVDQAVVTALRDRLNRLSLTLDSPRAPGGYLLALGRQSAALPDYDTRAAEEILGYDQGGAACPNHGS